MRRLELIRDELMGSGYIVDKRRSKKNLRCTEGIDYWIDCLLGGRNIRFKWKTAIYPHDPFRGVNETFEVLNAAGTRPMLEDHAEVFELNRMMDYESLDLFGTETTVLSQAIRMARLGKI